MNFEYLNVSVAQKLTKLNFFVSEAVKSRYLQCDHQKPMLEALQMDQNQWTVYTDMF